MWLHIYSNNARTPRAGYNPLSEALCNDFFLQFAESEISFQVHAQYMSSSLKYNIKSFITFIIHKCYFCQNIFTLPPPQKKKKKI